MLDLFLSCPPLTAAGMVGTFVDVREGLWGRVGIWLVERLDPRSVCARLIERTPMLLGEFSHNLDDKGRLAMPSKLRNELGDGAVITRGTDHCLVVYPQAAWTELATKLAALPISDAKARSFSRLMLAGAMAVEFDKQGRVNVPSYLRDYASLKGNVVIAGVYNRIELWDAATWESYKAGHSIDENLSEFGV